MQKPNRPSAAFCVVVCPESSRTDAPGRARAGAEPAPPDLEETKRSPAADRRENGDPRSAWDFRVQSAQETYALVTDEDVDVLPDTPVLAQHPIPHAGTQFEQRLQRLSHGFPFELDGDFPLSVRERPQVSRQ